jgi:RNA ligase
MHYTKITKGRLDQLVEEGWLISQVHPALDLTIYNYSQKTQYESHWTPETLMCRGLVLNSDGDIVARPFAKFFNASEHGPGEIPELPFEVYEKMDGSLGIFFWYAYGGHLHPVFASRGSFTSEQALRGWELLQQHSYRDLAYGHTHLFEIIYPENRIVVNYGSEEKLVLLSVIVTADGREVPRKDIEEHLGNHFDLVKGYNITESWEHLRSQNEPNREGYVIRFSNGFRVKVKFEEYVRLHRIITNVSNLDIWEKLRAAKPLDELLEKVPDEFFDWVKETARDLIVRYRNVERDYCSYFFDITDRVLSSDRKAYAEEALHYRHSGILFSMYDGKDYSQAIWKMIRPTYSKPFNKDADDLTIP